VLAALATLLLGGGLVMLASETAAQAPVTLAVDADSTGNTATSLGSVEECISVERGATFEVDITVKSVQNLLGWEAFFVYDKSILEVTNVNVRLFQQANGRSNVINASESVPDRDGLFFMAAADVGKATDSGDGVLARLTLTGVATGISPARLPQIDFNDDDIPDRGPVLSSLTFDTVNHVGDTNGDKLFDGDTSHARVAVGVPCTARPTPEPTPGTPAPGTPAPGTPAPGTPTPGTPPASLPDSDRDVVADGGDQCPGTPSGEGVDPSGCSDAQLEALKEETRQELLEEAVAGLTLGVSLATVTVGGSTDVLAVFAGQDGDPIPGVDITFKIEQQPGSDADLEGESEVIRTSDAEGVGEARLYVGSTAGEIAVSASAEGVTETATVTIVEATGGQAPETELTPGSGAGATDGTPEPAGGGLSAWFIAVLAGGALALTVGMLAAWRAARHTSI